MGEKQRSCQSLEDSSGSNAGLDDVSDSELDSSADSGCLTTPLPVGSPRGRRLGRLANGRGLPSGETPPYKRVRALRLFESPLSPSPDACNSSTPDDRRVNVPNRPEDRFAEANVNPFAPSAMVMASRSRSSAKRPRSRGGILNGSLFNASMEELMEEDEDDETHVAKKIHFRGNNISRYNAEFLEICRIGCGQFGSVYKCINKLDGCTYALKKSQKPIRGTLDEKTALNEVCAHAVLGTHPHVVRYYSAWAEDDHMVIQNEYCNGGSLADVIADNEQSGYSYPEIELKRILLHVAEGLQYIHSQNLVHLDIKPGNIFISRNKKVVHSSKIADSSDDGFEDDDGEEEETIYKIGDLGHVTSCANPQVEEGDCRYLPMEILQEDYTHLPQADIFALGLTVFEAGGGGPLAKNGEQWHAIRDGKLPCLERYSEDLNSLLEQMIHPDPEARPSSLSLTQHGVLVPYANKTKAQLRQELNAERFKNDLLSRQLQEAVRCLQNVPIKVPCSSSRNGRLVGHKAHRSRSVTNF